VFSLAPDFWSNRPGDKNVSHDGQKDFMHSHNSHNPAGRAKQQHNRGRACTQGTALVHTSGDVGVAAAVDAIVALTTHALLVALLDRLSKRSGGADAMTDDQVRHGRW
jgi:hypothetical protein